MGKTTGVSFDNAATAGQESSTRSMRLCLYGDVDGFDRRMARLLEGSWHRLSNAFAVDGSAAQRILARGHARQQRGPVNPREPHGPGPRLAARVKAQRASRYNAIRQVTPIAGRRQDLSIGPWRRRMVRVSDRPLGSVGLNPDLHL